MKAVLLFVLTLALSSCAQPVSAPSARLTDEEALRERASSYWEAKKSRNGDEMVRFLDPEKREALEPRLRTGLGPKRAADLIEYRITEVRTDGETGVVSTLTKVKFVYPVLRSMPMREDVISERWLKKDGTWFFSPEYPSLG